MSLDPSQLNLDSNAAVMAAFLLTFLELIRRHLKKSEALDERRVKADETQAVATAELVTEVRRLLDRMARLEDRFDEVTPLEHHLPPQRSGPAGPVPDPAAPRSITSG